jgi:uncharacterized protein (TIGR02145 family)
MTKSLFLTLALGLILEVTSSAQSIKLNNQDDPGSAMLEVSSPSKGILIPNVSLTGTTDATTITSPETSLLVYNTATVSNLIPGYYYNSGTSGSPIWTRLSTGTLGDGSETKVIAGNNVSITGAGTPANPYIINAPEVDGDVTNELQNLSEVLSENNDAGTRAITNLANPINAQDPATKKYVDDNNDDADADPTNELDNTDEQDLANVLGQGANANALAITNLANPTNDQDAATKYYVDSIKASFNEDLLDAGLNGFVEDIEGNKYKTIKIGAQVWMAENLRTTMYNNGSAIPKVTDPTAWSILTTPAFTWFRNDSTLNAKLYGALYNYHVVSEANVCPVNWHVPTDSEWSVLSSFLIDNGFGYQGSGSNIGKSMASTFNWFRYGIADESVGKELWSNNRSGFSGLPGGFRIDYGVYDRSPQSGYWWSSTENNLNAWFRSLNYYDGNFDRDSYNKGCGLSVRCLKD